MNKIGTKRTAEKTEKVNEIKSQFSKKDYLRKKERGFK